MLYGTICNPRRGGAAPYLTYNEWGLALAADQRAPFYEWQRTQKRPQDGGFHARVRCSRPGVGGYAGCLRGVDDRTRRSAPRKGRSGPRPGCDAPLFGCLDGGGAPFGPRLGRSGPFLGASAPELGPTVPEEGLTGPLLGQTAPLLGASAPGVGRTAPTEGLAGPGLGRTAPGVGATGPGVGRSGPKMGPKLPPGETPASFRQGNADKEGVSLWGGVSKISPAGAPA